MFECVFGDLHKKSRLLLFIIEKTNTKASPPYVGGLMVGS